MDGEGFEPSKAEPPDLQSGAFDHFAIHPNRILHSIKLSCRAVYQDLNLESSFVCFQEFEYDALPVKLYLP